MSVKNQVWWTAFVAFVVQNRLKIRFIKLDFFKLDFSKIQCKSIGGMSTKLLHRILRPSYGTEFWDCLRVENGGRARQLCIPPSFVVWIALIAIACFIYQAKWLWWLLSCQIMTLFKVAYNEMYHMYVCTTHNRTLFILVCKLTSRVWLA